MQKVVRKSSTQKSNTMKIRFELRQYQQKKEQPLFMVITAGREKRIKIVVLDIKIHPDLWDMKTQRLRNTKEIKTRHEINAVLNEMQATAQKVIDYFLLHEPPLTYEKVNTKIREIYPHSRAQKAENKEIEKSTAKEKITFWQFVEKFIKELSTKIHQNGKISAKQTVKLCFRTPV